MSSFPEEASIIEQILISLKVFITPVWLDGDLANCTWLLSSREGALLKEAE